MAKPRTAPPSAPKPAQDGKPADVPDVTEENAADASPTKDGSVPEEGRGEPEFASSAVSAADGAALDQPQGDQTAADEDVGTGAEASSPGAASIDTAAASTASTAGEDGAPSTWCFEVLSPFKYDGVIIKPPAWIEMTWDEAEDYQEAGVLGDEPATPEELE
ncbi:TPA: hypothetical protein ACXN3R_003651 [Stenotrophomonas maltophilia]|uniref:hypothetical protein n=2 Tax=Stenotrophomonas maltophilia TaxID=40324 RepID=UPI0028938B8E|nr:hypothetical protein [Stenotrophomonas maltophilia]MDT3474781.1 hypothetical protein [Stenotrophomonas maltophilia]